MTAKQQINAIASAVRVVEGFAAEHSADATVEEDILRIGVYAAAIELGQRLTAHFDRGDMTADEWDAQTELADYNSEEQAIITNVAEQS